MNTYLNFSTEISNKFKFIPHGDIQNNPPVISYQINSTSGEWNTYTLNTEVSLPANSKVYFKGNNNGFNVSMSDYITFSSEGAGNISGNIMSLLDSELLSKVIPCDNCFYKLFKDNDEITFNGLELPATTLKQFCYCSMFDGCESLTAAPSLPATTLIKRCYDSMFNNCSSLETAPILPATTLAEYCYSNMFYGCTSLTTAPVLPATTLADNCYSGMFSGCSSLSSISIVYNNSNLFDYTSNWLSGVSTTGTFACTPEVGTQSTITRSDSACPTTWTVSNIVDVPYYKSIVTNPLTTKIKKVKYLTQSEYNSLTNKDYNTEYRITDYVPSVVSASSTGTSTNEVGYITIDGVESKLPEGTEVSVSGIGTSTNDVRYITIDGTESRFTSVALRAMKSAWVTGTTQAAATAILNDDSVVAGDGFLATVYWSDLPGDLTQAEVKAFVMKKSTSYQKIIQFECTSGTVAPYSWFYNSYERVWRSQVPLNNTVTSTATNEALTANMGKALQDQITNLQNIGRFLSIWNCTTGLPETDPTVTPYTYRTGDYYRVGTIATEGGTNYKPTGSSYNKVASTVVETETVAIGAVYYYDGSVWRMQAAGGGGTVQDVQVNGTSILEAGSGVANIGIAGPDSLGVIKTNITYGVAADSNGTAYVVYANNEDISAKISAFKPVVPANLDKAVMEGLGNNSLTWTDEYKASARSTIGAAAPITITFKE